MMAAPAFVADFGIQQASRQPQAVSSRGTKDVRLVERSERSTWPHHHVREDGRTLLEQPDHRHHHKPYFRVPSLIFELELDDLAPTSRSRDPETEGVLEKIGVLLKSNGLSGKELTLDTNTAFEAAKHCADAEVNNFVAEHLTELGYDVHIRTALGGGEGGECLRNLRHSFISCSSPGSRVQYVIDPKFKEQFLIAHTTERYAALLDALPDMFIGAEASLAAVVEILCSEMSTAFQKNGDILPPWRQFSSMISKWRPRRSVEGTVNKETQGLMRPKSSAHSSNGCGRTSSKKSSFEPNHVFLGGNFVPAAWQRT